jgi:pyruvate/2-oxoglutarate dehydrogenase complex dihydrolipoamide acyltransferase (E2) component
MRIPIEMTNVGFEQATAKLAGWTKRVGDSVRRGDVIVEVETEKTTVELEALDEGTLVEIVHDTGDEVAIGAVIGYLDDGR